MNLAPVEFVNIHGQYVDTNKRVKIKRETKLETSSHSGWRVEGIPPGALEAARERYRADLRLAEVAGSSRMPKPLNEEQWLMNAKTRPVRSKPYAIPDAAEQCKALAEKAGWLRVTLKEIKKEVQEPAAGNVIA